MFCGVILWELSIKPDGLRKGKESRYEKWKMRRLRYTKDTRPQVRVNQNHKRERKATMENLKQLNKERLARIKEDGVSHGMRMFIDQIQQAQEFNARQPQVRRNGEEYHRKIVTVYFAWVTENRLTAHIVTNDGDNPRLERLVIPEAGHRMYANYKDGYQANGGGYSKPFHILEAMVFQAEKHIDVDHEPHGTQNRYNGRYWGRPLNIGGAHWQDFIVAEVIA